MQIPFRFTMTGFGPEVWNALRELLFCCEGHLFPPLLFLGSRMRYPAALAA